MANSKKPYFAIFLNKYLPLTGEGPGKAECEANVDGVARSLHTPLLSGTGLRVSDLSG